MSCRGRPPNAGPPVTIDPDGTTGPGRPMVGRSDAFRTGKLKLAAPATIGGLTGIPDAVKSELRGDDGLDRVKLIQYALDNWDKKSDKTFPDDCTNFVSDALAAGGSASRGHSPAGVPTPNTTGTRHPSADRGATPGRRPPVSMISSLTTTAPSFHSIRPSPAMSSSSRARQRASITPPSSPP